MNLKLTFLLLGFSANAIQAQSSLDNYVENGLKNNLVLQQKNIALEKAMLSRKTANSLFFPAVGLKGDYQSGEGGRQIAIPLGDMLNPVYTTLNQLTKSDAFPQINNVKTNFFPKNFYDVKVRTSMPIINSDLIYNKQIQKTQIVLQQYEVEIYKNELTKNIKVAYYNYLSASRSIGIYENALQLAKEGKRINESLYQNGKSVKAYVLRSESEIQNLEAQQSSAMQQVKNTQMYFNFLLNENMNRTIDTSGTDNLDQVKLNTYLNSETSVKNRTELKALTQSISVYQTVLKMNQAFWMPKLSGFVDLGSQASDWKYNQQSRYYFIGLQLDIPLFAAGKNTHKIKQAELDLKNQLLDTSVVGQQIRLAAEMAQNNLKSAYDNYMASTQQVEAATAYNKLIEKGYKEGIHSFIESIDARNQLTTTALKMVINRYQLLIALAICEREYSTK